MKGKVELSIDNISVGNTHEDHGIPKDVFDAMTNCADYKNNGCVVLVWGKDETIYDAIHRLNKRHEK